MNASQFSVSSNLHYISVLYQWILVSFNTAVTVTLPKRSIKLRSVMGDLGVFFIIFLAKIYDVLPWDVLQQELMEQFVFCCFLFCWLKSNPFHSLFSSSHLGCRLDLTTYKIHDHTQSAVLLLLVLKQKNEFNISTGRCFDQFQYTLKIHRGRITELQSKTHY